MKLFIAIDDTDNHESIGTGRLSRMLATELNREGLIEKSRVTRHQLLVHPDIPYTSHNSSACIDTVIKEGTIHDITTCAIGFLHEHFHQGANPGLCIADQDAVPEGLPSFGIRAQREVIPLDEAKRLADRLGIVTWWNGETGQGCIGAMAAVGLRSTSNDGRYIELDGIRGIGGMVSVGEMLSLTAIDRVTTLSGEDLPAGEIVDTQDWVRPVLKGGLVTLEVIPLNGCWRAPHEKKAKKEKLRERP
ncbi:MAG: hypothetical protein JXI32_01970 [Deltaproteobacteria bacterium]|nr:hypothetical protein [Deltaproteobacteria bacterium]